jgi:hypothetical protein
MGSRRRQRAVMFHLGKTRDLKARAARCRNSDVIADGPSVHAVERADGQFQFGRALGAIAVPELVFPFLEAGQFPLRSLEQALATIRVQLRLFR